MRISVERMRLPDLDDVLRIERASYPTPWRPETFRYEICDNPNAHYVVARAHFPEGPVTVGYAGMWLIIDEAHITTIAVDPNYRGLKIGERLLLTLLTAATQKGACRATLEVRESNLVAQRLYLKYHFGAAGMRRGYYTDSGENAIIMWIENLHDPRLQRFMSERRRCLEEQGALARC
ncbi:MAG TPA: ribosomal protein S18-alanine N-acetyltransferase [Armatimonadetes bacterium]|jgi:ribosomal-protein-alanine N-acetyltransferase|nr:ribosomal protein S18-alanine N-acetyltransferase [Armatimonadota bacterium]